MLLQLGSKLSEGTRRKATALIREVGGGTLSGPIDGGSGVPVSGGRTGAGDARGILQMLDGDINPGETIVARLWMPTLTSDKIASAVWADTERDSDFGIGHGPNV